MNEIAVRTSRHESRHVSAAWVYGWPIRSVSRARGWEGLTEVVPPTWGDLNERALEAAVVTVMPALVDTVGCDEDLAKVRALIDACGSLRMSTVLDTARALEHDREFIRVRRLIEHALLSRPILTASEVEELLA